MNSLCESVFDSAYLKEYSYQLLIDIIYMTELFDIRKEYTQRTLDEKNVAKTPIDQFNLWLEEAISAGVNEPTAMTLSTSTVDGKPSSRVVLLKNLRAEGFVFFTNYESRKAKQLDENPHCALNFVWHELERQVRIEGKAVKIAPAESDSYFELRPEKSKLGAWASPQSRVIPNREYLEELMANYKFMFQDNVIQRPDNWGGYIVEPALFEFWQGRESRLHDRILYSKNGGGWLIERLAP